MHYKIKQLTNRNDYRFMDYDFAVKHGFDLNDYEVTYEGEIDAQGSVYKALEDLFTIFNVERPEDFKGHSLSVSDVVELDGKNYYCDFVSWREL